MRKTCLWIVRNRWIVIILCVALLIPSVLGIAATKTKYDLLYYLPQDLETVRGQEILLDEFGKGAYITKATAQLMRDFGCIQSPQNAFYINLGLETLHVRMERHCENALKVAKFLESQDKVAWVHYAGLENDDYYELAQKYLKNGTCGVLCFGVKGNRDDAIRFMDSLELATIATHVADARTCLLHPASHTHRQLTDEQLEEAGISPDLIRFSVGLENADDLIADLQQALDKM